MKSSPIQAAQHKRVSFLIAIFFVALSSCALPRSGSLSPSVGHAPTPAEHTAIEAPTLPIGFTHISAAPPVRQPMMPASAFFQPDAADQIPVIPGTSHTAASAPSDGNVVVVARPAPDPATEDQISRLQEEITELRALLAVQMENSDNRFTGMEQGPEPEPIPMPLPVFDRSLGVTVLREGGLEEGDKIRVRMDDADVFLPGTYDFLPATASNLLKTVATTLQNTYPDRQLGVEVHTDDFAGTGFDPDLALNISTEKATLISNFLVDSKVYEPRQLRAIGAGSSQPIADNATPEGRALNRRIEFVVLP